MHESNIQKIPEEKEIDTANKYISESLLYGDSKTVEDYFKRHHDRIPDVIRSVLVTASPNVEDQKYVADTLAKITEDLLEEILYVNDEEGVAKKEILVDRALDKYLDSPYGPASFEDALAALLTQKEEQVLRYLLRDPWNPGGKRGDIKLLIDEASKIYYHQDDLQVPNGLGRLLQIMIVFPEEFDLRTTPNNPLQ